MSESRRKRVKLNYSYLDDKFHELSNDDRDHYINELLTLEYDQQQQELAKQYRFQRQNLILIEHFINKHHEQYEAHVAFPFLCKLVVQLQRSAAELEYTARVDARNREIRRRVQHIQAHATQSGIPDFFATRTQAMLEAMDQIKGAEGPNFLAGYERLSRSTTNFNQKVASIGGDAADREIVLLDPSAKILKDLYLLAETTIVVNKLFANPTLEALLIALMDFVHLQTKDHCRDPSKMIYRMNDYLFGWLEKYANDSSKYAELKSGKRIPVMMLDDVITCKQFFYCRHHALLNAYLLYQLIQNGYLPTGEVRQIRGNKGMSAHTWVVYKITQGPDCGKVFMIDTSKRRDPINVREERESVEEKYGRGVVSVMLNEPEVKEAQPINASSDSAKAII